MTSVGRNKNKLGNYPLISLHNEKSTDILKYDSMNHLTNTSLVNYQTSSLKTDLIKAFKDFECKYGVDCSKIMLLLKRHDKYITNGRYYFKYNSGLNFLQKWKAIKQDILKLFDFYRTFKQDRTFFWTITKKRITLEKIYFKQSGNRLKIHFEEIDRSERNLRQLIRRLLKIGYHIEKYILVPEIKEKDFTYNYHYHVILEVRPVLNTILNNKNPLYRKLVWDWRYRYNRNDGWINNKVLSEIWKDITKDGSYRIKPEYIRSKMGSFNYLLSYLNKGIQFQNVQAVPYLYFALKSKKAYRLKGSGKLPKIKTTLLDHQKNSINFEYYRINYVNKEDIPIDKQEYYVLYHKDQEIVEEIHFIDYFNLDKKRYSENNHQLNNFDIKLRKNRQVWKKKNNWQDVETQFSKKEIQKLLTEGYIYDTNKGYRLV